MCEQFNCLFESQIALGYTSHHRTATLLLGKNDKTPSTVTLTTFGPVQTQLPFYTVGDLIFMALVTGCVFLLTAAEMVEPLLLIPDCEWGFVCAYKELQADVPEVISALTPACHRMINRETV